MNTEDPKSLAEVLEPQIRHLAVTDTFDVLNRNTTRGISLATGFGGSTAETREYDALNRVTRNENDGFRVDFAHGVLGLSSYPSQETQSYATGSALAKMVSTSRDAVGLKSTLTCPNGSVVAYSHDDAENLTGVSLNNTSIASMSYIGMRTKQTVYGNLVTQTRSFSGFRCEVSSTSVKDVNQTVLARKDYGYTALHEIAFERNGGSGSSGDAFEYDKAGAIKRAYLASAQPESPASAAYVKKIDYNLSGDGLRDSVVETPWQQTAQAKAYSHNNMNEYASIGSVQRTHDACGNLTNDGTYRYQYDYKSQVVAVRSSANNSLVASYRYDALGRRAEKAVVASGTTDRIVYDGATPLQVFNSSNAVKQTFVFGDEDDTRQRGMGGDDMVPLPPARPPPRNPDLLVIWPKVDRHPIAMVQKDVMDQDSDSDVQEATTSFFHSDASGSVLAVTGALGGVLVNYHFGPLGERSIFSDGNQCSSDPLGQPFGFRGRWTDEETGLSMCADGLAYSPDSGSLQQRENVCMCVSTLDPAGGIVGQQGTGKDGGDHEYADPLKKKIEEITKEAAKRLKAAFDDHARKSHQAAEHGFLWHMVHSITALMKEINDAFDAAKAAVMQWMVEQLLNALDSVLPGNVMEAVTDALQGISDIVGGVQGLIDGALNELDPTVKEAIRTIINLAEAAGIGEAAVNAVKAGVDGFIAGTARAGKGFSKSVKKAAKERAMEKAGGALKSEMSGTDLVPGVKHTKGVTPPSNEAHVDHIQPRSRGGAIA